MSSTRKTPVRTRAFTARSTLSVLAAVATAAPKTVPAPLGKAANDKAANDRVASGDTSGKAAPLPARAPLSREERHGLIAKVAYGYAERAGFGSDPVKDWLTAEREIDAMYGIAS